MSFSLEKRDRRKIWTSVKLLTFLGILPDEYYKKLSKSQISRYKNHFKPNDYFGYELSRLEEDIVGQIRQINSSKIDRKVISGYLRLACVLRKAFVSAKHYKSTLKKNHDKLVDIIQDFKDWIPVTQFASLLKVDESTVRHWIRDVRVKCSGTITNLCRKTHPNQLLEADLDLMKNLLTDKDKLYWPLVSVYYFALNHNIVSMGLSTWYKYVDLLGIRRLKPKSVKHYGESVAGLFPNHYWHADVTQFRTKNNVLHYIYLVVDNYSKKILSWAIDTKLCKEVRTQTFKDALGIAVDSYMETSEINLIVDGGSENNNRTVDGFIESLLNVTINKEVALKTVHFSNAMAEATNRIVKTYYLNQQYLEDTRALLNYFPFVMDDLNGVRPHGQLKGLTPNLAYAGVKPETDRFIEQKQVARRKRIETNQDLGCCKVWK
jgi:hypothetical protein